MIASAAAGCKRMSAAGYLRPLEPRQRSHRGPCWADGSRHLRACVHISAQTFTFTRMPGIGRHIGEWNRFQRSIMSVSGVTRASAPGSSE
jgi:hypothetical protein